MNYFKWHEIYKKDLKADLLKEKFKLLAVFYKYKLVNKYVKL